MIKYAFGIFVIITGIVLSYATYSLLALLNSPMGNKPMAMACYGVIFFFTVPRFFFGNLTFFGRTYSPAGTAIFITSKLTTNLIDFYFCLVELLLFLFVATSITENPFRFILGLLIISGIDIIWHSMMVWYGMMQATDTTNREISRASKSWTVINVITGTSCFLFLYHSNWSPTTDYFWILALVYTAAFFADFICNSKLYSSWDEIS